MKTNTNDTEAKQPASAGCISRLVRLYSYPEKLGISAAILVDFNEGLSPTIRASGGPVLSELSDAHKDILTAFGAYEFLPSGVDGTAFSCGGSDYVSSWIRNIIHGIYDFWTNVKVEALPSESGEGNINKVTN